jgi:uncharacterized protein YidB (DUF937 family)
MGILDNLTGMLSGGQGGEGEKAEGAMSILGSLLQQGGGEGQSSNIVSTLLGAAGGAMQGGPASAGEAQGGMAGMLETLAANGLAEHVGSWLSNNPNMPISADQIRSALGSEQVQSMANSAGLPVGDFLKHLADHLPAAAAQAAGTEGPAA